MDNQTGVLTGNNILISSAVEEQKIISLHKFVILSIASFGLYEIWWIYKSWRYYQQKEDLDILPAARAIFCVFFLNSLFKKILNSAKDKGYQDDYSSVALFIGFFIMNIFTKLPDPYWLITTFSFVFFIPPFRALNYEKLNSGGFTATHQTYFNGRQIALIGFGSLFWCLVILGLFMEP